MRNSTAHFYGFTAASSLQERNRDTDNMTRD